MSDALPASLAAALEAQDPVAVAFAIRNHLTTVPVLPAESLQPNRAEGPTRPEQVRVFRRGDADKYMLLLFSSPETYRRMLPREPDAPVAAYDREALRSFLADNVGVLEAVWFDVAGPHAMQAEPADILKALTLEAD